MQAPAAAAASRIARAEGVSTESGFSQYTALPASIAAKAISAWRAFGAVIATTSTSGSPVSCRQSPVERAKPRAAAERRAVASSTSARRSRRGTAGRSNSPATARNALAWHFPMNPAPISPTRTTGFVSSSNMACSLVVPAAGAREPDPQAPECRV